MTSLADVEPDTGRTYTCRVTSIIAADEKSDALAAKVAARFADPTISNRSLARWLGISENSIVKHRGSKTVDPYCSCVR